MNTNSKDKSVDNDNSDHNRKNSANDLDNDTYGHSNTSDVYKRKNKPVHEVSSDTDASTKLKDLNIIGDEDLASRNKTEEKGIGGK